MKIKLCDTTIDTSKIKQIHNKKKKLIHGLNKVEIARYSIEFNDGTFKVITKQEYKMLEKTLKGE